jgi:thiol-disulfide isomerase/thioredoxin
VITTNGTSDGDPPGAAGSPHRALRRGAQLAILAGVAVLVIVLLAAKGQPTGPGTPPGPVGGADAREVTLDRALAANQPTLAFFHSQTCDSCIEMTAIVQEVYPEFKGSVTLVDVDVYDPRNDALLGRVRVPGIPTVVLFDRSGEATWLVGVTAADQLRARLLALAAES